MSQLGASKDGRSAAGGRALLVFIVALVVLAGVVGLARSELIGAPRVFTARATTAGAVAEGTTLAALNRSADEPLSRADAIALQRTVGPTLVNISVDLSSAHAIGAGTGIVLSASGDILTNNHVIRGADAIRVTSIATGRSYPASVVGADARHDIAVLRVRGGSGFRPARIGDSDSVQVGDYVAAIGNAGGVGGRPSVATGPVTNLNRTIRTSDELTGSTERLTGLIEANANIQPGDSGGPMVNSAGEVVGVDVAASVDSKTDEPAGTGFAIPINDAMGIARSIASGAATEQVRAERPRVSGVMVPLPSGQAPAGRAAVPASWFALPAGSR